MEVPVGELVEEESYPCDTRLRTNLLAHLTRRPHTVAPSSASPFFEYAGLFTEIGVLCAGQKENACASEMQT